MTSATELLCKLLDERGVEWWDSRYGEQVVFQVGEVKWFANDGCRDGMVELSTILITPDQAIAATLGSDASAARLAERLRSIADEMRNVGASSMKPHELLAFYAREVDKVADTLKFAATLGNGTCRNEWAEFGKFRCSECWTQVDAISTNTTQPMPIRYCPNCGAKVVG